MLLLSTIEEDAATPFSLVVVFDSFPHFFLHRPPPHNGKSVFGRCSGSGGGRFLVVKSVFKNRETKNSKKGEKEQRRGAVTDDEASFACERVCASDRLLKRMGVSKGAS